MTRDYARASLRKALGREPTEHEVDKAQFHPDECVKIIASAERLQELLTRVERDFGFEYAYDDGLEALRELRRLIGGEPDPNVAL